MNLVLAGSHRQYLAWLATTGRLPAEYRPVREPRHLWGLLSHDVDELHRVGTYWDNPAWGSEEYRRLMVDGVRVGRAWAMTWEADWVAAAERRT